MNTDVRELCQLDIELYKCITDKIATEKVVLTDKSIIHMADHHPDAYNDVLIELKETIMRPDYILKDDNHEYTGLVIREINSTSEHAFIVLKICTNTENGKYCNSVISGWKISDKRLQSYLRNKEILYNKQ